MKNKATERLDAGVQTSAQPARVSRWPTLWCAAALLWCAWWYCHEASQGLLFLTVGLAAVAAALPRPAPHTVRWVVWLSLLVAVAFFAANVSRLIPPEGTVGDARVPDRIVTLLFALGAASLFFSPRANGVTMVAVAGLPMVMMVLGREGNAVGAVDGSTALLLIWLFIGLVVVADLVQRLTSPCGREQPSPGAGDAMWRLASLAGVLALAYVLRAPVEQGALFVQKKVFGWVTNTGEGVGNRRGSELSLKQPPPADFSGRMRVMLLVQADRFPGYLRESVFTTYAGGRWQAPKPGAELRQDGAALTGGRQAAYRLGSVGPQERALLWQVEVMAPQLLGGFCLPGSAVRLQCEGPAPLADADGTVTAAVTLPDRFETEVVTRRVAASVYPLPDGGGDPAYLNVPPSLAGAVSNWVSACDGLAGEKRVAAAGARVEAFFQTNFIYRLGVALCSTPDPLVDFMKRREGSCTYFASAAALMFRSCGMPTRVVGGYVCCGWNPWLNRWVVRERESHAWVEVWDLSAKRWLLVDPTPACGNPAALPGPGRMRFAADLLVAAWKRLVTGLKGMNVLEAIADMGETLFIFLWHTVWSLAGAVVLAGFSAVWWVRRRSRKKPQAKDERLRTEMTEAMCGIARKRVPGHLRRRACEGWDLWLGRIGPDLPVPLFTEMREWAESYQALRYSERMDELAARRWLVRARQAKGGLARASVNLRRP